MYVHNKTLCTNCTFSELRISDQKMSQRTCFFFDHGIFSALIDREERQKQRGSNRGTISYARSVSFLSLYLPLY